MPNLEKTVDFNISDCFVPFKSLRHWPEILKYNNKSKMVGDLIITTFLMGAQIDISFKLIQSLHILYILTY